MSILLLFPIRLNAIWQLRLPVRLACAAGAALFCAFYLTVVLWNETLQQKIGVDTNSFRPSESYENGSFATSFLIYTGAVSPKKPEGYSEQTFSRRPSGFRSRTKAVSGNRILLSLCSRAITGWIM